MERLKLFVLTMMMMVAQAVLAQSTIVKGILVDDASNEGEPYATVRVYRAGAKEKPVAMFLTDAEGAFSQEVKGKGSFEISFGSVGKEELKQALTLSGEATKDLGTLRIKENATMLGSVEVVAQKPLVKMEVDKMSYNVAEDEDSKSNTVLDMLRKVPMVTVDGQDNISVNGSSSFKIYVDGKPNVMMNSNPSVILKSMPATAVKSIEVVTNPGARFDAEGASGVLNIVMNKIEGMPGGGAPDLDGYTGSLTARAGDKTLGASAFVSGQKGKLSYSANVMYNQMKPGSTTVEMMQEQNGGNSGAGTMLTTSETTPKIPFTMGNISLGYDLDAKSSLSATLSFSTMEMKNKAYSLTQMTGGMYGTGFSYGNNNEMKTSRNSFSGNLDYQRFFNQNRTSYMTLTYQLTHSPSENEQRSDFENTNQTMLDLTDRYSLSKENTTEHTFQADFTTPLSATQTLNTGAKLMLRHASSDSKYYLNDVYNQLMSMDYSHNNSILAGYAEYSSKLGNWGLKGGLRYEHTWQSVEYKLDNGQDFDTSYGSLVPTANISYSLAPTSNLGLTYNMRISRPGISYLNPYVDRSNPTALTYGNDDLDVEKSHNLGLVYNLYTPKLMLNATLNYSFTNNGIEQYSFYDNDNLLNTTYGNIVKRQTTGLNLYANWLLAPNTRLFANGGVSYSNMSSDALGYDNSGWHANVMAGLQQTLPWNLKLGAFLISSSKTYTLQGWSSGQNILTANLSKSFFNDKLNISVMGITGLSKGGSLNMETYSKGKGFSTSSNIKVPLNGITFSVSYTFGNTKRQARMHQNKVSSDFIEQQSQGEIINSVGSGMGNNGMPMQQQ